MTIKADIQSLTPSAVIELFEVDLTAQGDSIYYFHAGTNELSQAVVWQGQEYAPWPAQAKGFDYNTSGQLPRPQLTLANNFGAITAIILVTNDCVGGKVTRRRTLAKYLDAVNFAAGNAGADPDAYLPDEIYYIDRKASEDSVAVVFELTAAFDVSGVKLPRRQIVQNLCPWRYRGEGCGYAGMPVADSNDNRLSGGVTALEVAYFDAWDAWDASKIASANALNVVEIRKKALDLAKDYVLLSENYSYPTPPVYYVKVINISGTDTIEAYFNGVQVTLGAEYRLGRFVENIQVGVLQSYRGLFAAFSKIEHWGYDAGVLAAAQASYDTALSEYDTAIANEAAALAAYNAAGDDLPSDSPVLLRDVCGKRLDSCKLRFGENSELPFGGFPGVGFRI